MPRLTEKQKRSIVARYAQGETQVALAKRFGVHYNTIYETIKSVRADPETGLSSDWRRQLSDDCPPLAVNAFMRSMSDLGDPHRAAATGAIVMKGLGHLANDAPTTNIKVELQKFMLALPDDVRDQIYSPEQIIELTQTSK